MSYSNSQADSPIHGLFSPEGVRLEMPAAGPAPRMFAYGIDWLLVMLLLILLLIAFYTTLPLGELLDKWINVGFKEASAAAHGHSQNFAAFGRLTGLLIAMLVLTQFVIETGYFIFWEMLTGGRSPGKVLVGLRVVHDDGSPMDFRSSVVRNVMRLVDMLPANYVVGLVAMLLSESGQRLGDHAAGTIVIRLDRPEAAAEIEMPEHPPSFTLTRDQLARVGPRELQLLRATLRRMAALPETRRRQLVEEVAEAMRMRLEMAEFPSEDRLAFLEDILAIAERHAANG